APRFPARPGVAPAPSTLRPMLLAELEIRHSRAVAPTRRVALGPHWLPTEPAPGYGGILLGGIVAAHLVEVDPELRDEFLVLVDDLEEGRRFSPDERWALEILGFGPDETQPGREEVLARFRSLLRESHPDHGAEHEGAGQRILELTEARRILLP